MKKAAKAVAPSIDAIVIRASNRVENHANASEHAKATTRATQRFVTAPTGTNTKLDVLRQN
ncbi:MAG: hypothetical protein Aurels2KO_26370 [Aureliella sp.]